MTKINVVKTARIKCINPKQLRVGDFILWSCFQCKVIEILGGQNKFAIIEQFFDEPESRMTIPRFSTFYKIIEVEIIERKL